MRRLLAALALAAAVPLFFTARPAGAADHLRGIVLSVTGTTAIVHHDPFAGMPAMTMSFRLPNGTVVHSGDAIAADVDRSSDPWSLSDVRVTRAGGAVAVHLPAFVRAGDRVPDIALVDQRGRPFRLSSLRGTPYALTFAYTRCADPSMCPLVSAKFERIQRGSAHDHIALVEISLDPAYDRPPVLARYGAMFGADPARWHLATGDPQTVLDFAARFGILERSAGPVTIVHTERLAIVGADGTIERLDDGAGWQPDAVIQALRRS
jgi:protein SCO1/2